MNKRVIHAKDPNLLEDLENMIDRWKETDIHRTSILGTYVCSYDDHIGIYEKVGDNRFIPWIPGVGAYVEIDENHIGKVKKSHIDSKTKRVVYDDIESFHIISTENNIPLEELRVQMFNEGIIKDYRVAEINASEMADVIIYAHDYFLNAKNEKSKSNL